MKKILVIEDDPQVRIVLEVALQRAGYEVSAAENGKEGLAMAKELLPDLILCDVNMPEMDGRGVLQAVRADPALAHRQVVLMTGDQGRNPQREGMNLGADDYLSKPFEIGQLQQCVEARLRKAAMLQRLEDGMLRRHADMFGVTLPHEIITPLNGILGFAEILKEDIGKIPAEEAAQMLTNIETSARRLHRTLMNFLLLMNIENDLGDPPEAAPSVIPGSRVAEIIKVVAAEVADLAKRNRDVAVAAEPVDLAVKETELRTIVEHLVENACAYSPEGTPVAVRFRREEKGPTLRVEDRGRGMTSEQVEQIGVFRQFERKKFEQQGLGIGLTLVKRMAGRQGGSLRIESKPGEGTTAVVEFR